MNIAFKERKVYNTELQNLHTEWQVDDMKHIKNILNIFISDFKRIICNPVAVVISLGLVILPSLYAWLNIAANWDPYSNTKGLKVAVVNLDQGTTIDQVLDINIDDSSINIGEMILDELRKNQQIGWQFVDQEEALEGVESGKYYAAVMVPEDFSQKLSSVLTSHVEHPVLQYYVNEKKNAIATKITDKGVESVQKQINETFINSTSNAIGKVLNKYSGDWRENKETGRERSVKSLTDAKADLKGLSDTISLLQSTLKTVNHLNEGIQSSLPDVGRLADSGGQTAESARTMIDSARGFSSTLTGGLKGTLEQIRQVEDSMKDSLEIVEDLVDVSADGGADGLLAVENLAAGTIDQCSRINETLGALNGKLPVPLGGISQMQQKLTEHISRQQALVKKLQTARQAVKRTKRLPDNFSEDIETSLEEARISISDILDYYTGQVEEPLKDSLNKTYDTLGVTAEALDHLGGITEQISTTLTSLTDSSQSLIQALDSSLSLLARGEERIGDVIEGINKLADNRQLNKIIDIVQNDPDQLSNFLMMPTDMSVNKLYPVENYGSAMAPFYTILAIWVGGLILVAILKCRVGEEQARGLKLYETYFGRYLTFMAFGAAQGLVVALGDLYMLKIQCLYPGKFILAAVIASIIFTNIIYSMTISFGDVGKAVVVVFMVLQVAGSGGTFPIQVTPRFFQLINPILPFTHLINAMRECVAGMYEGAYWKYIGYALVYIPISLLIGTVLRRKVLKLNEFLEEKLSQTGII